MGPGHVQLQPELETIGLLAAGGKDVVGWPAHLPLGPGEELTVSEGPGLDGDPHGGGDVDAHVVWPHGSEQ